MDLVKKFKLFSGVQVISKSNECFKMNKNRWKNTRYETYLERNEANGYRFNCSRLLHFLK